MDIVLRNLERLVNGGTEGEEKERMEPMSEWKWHRLYDLARRYGVEGWVADGMVAYGDDFFLQPPKALREQMT